MKTNKPVLVLAVLAASVLSGCVTTHVELPGGGKFDRTAILNKTGVGSLKYSPSTGAWELKGYGNDNTELAAALTEAAVRGATQK